MSAPDLTPGFHGDERTPPTRYAGTLTAPQGNSAAETDDDLVHLVCDCDEFVALCGEGLEDAKWDYDEDANLCPMCLLVEDDTCARCGS